MANSFEALLQLIFIGLCIFASKLRANGCSDASLGLSACIPISRYNAKQWSTCVTDVYIRQKSKGRHGCAKGQAICIYQCMLEVHGVGSGNVTSPCRCSTRDELKTGAGTVLKTVKPISLLPTCFSPTGADCSWFRTCLGKRYSCGSKFRSEIINFSERLCGLYLNAYSDLSSNGNIWINGVRKCLQVTLVPLLRKWHGTSEQNCESLTKHAISSFKHCFYSPYPATVPTICSLPLTDLWRIFWHIRQTSEEEQYSLLALLKTIENCTNFRKVNLNRGKVRKLVFRVKHHGKTQERSFLSEDLGRKVAKYCRLDKEGIVWFAYPRIGKTSINNTIIKLVFYIADKHEHRMSQKSEHNHVANLNKTVSTLVEAVRKNKLCFHRSGSTQDYCVVATTVCQDLGCRNNTWKVLADKSLSMGSSNGSPVTAGPVLVTGVLIHFALYILSVALMF